MSNAFCGLPSGSLIYVGPESKEDFDRIELPLVMHEWKADATTTLLKGDGRQWERRCHSKALGDFSNGTVTVVFQWFDERTAPLPP